MTADLETIRRSLRTGEESVRRRLVEQLGQSRQPQTIPLLLVAVTDEVWTVRQAASEALASFSLSVLLPALESSLRDHENASSRNAAMEIYVGLGAAVVPQLIVLLSDADDEVRIFAAVMLGTIRDARAVAPLITALEDENVNVRHAAAMSLGQIGSPAAVQPLIAVLRAEPWLQFSAIFALGAIGDPAATSALVDLLGDESLRGAVIEALGLVGGREVLRHIVPYLYDSDPALRNIAIQSVVAIEQRATALGSSLDPEVQAALAREDLVEHLIHALSDEDPRNRRTAAITLGWLKEPRAERPLIELLGHPAVQEYVAHALVCIGFQSREAYQHGLAHPDDMVRQGTVRCLAWIAPPGAIDLVAPLIQDPSVEVRAEVAAAIGRLGDEDSALLLFELLGDESELIQESAMDALARMPAERVVPLLVQRLGSPEVAVRIRAAETLGLIRDPQAAPALIALARDLRENVRRAAIKALGEIDSPGILNVLRAALLDESSLVRQQAAASLGKLRDPAVTADLLPYLTDPDPKMRFVTIRALGQVRNPEVVPRLIPFLGDARKELRFAAVEALGEVRAYSAVQPLIGMLKDADRNLRRAAAEGLGSIGDPQAIPAVLLALEDDHWSVRCAAATALGRIRNPKATSGLLSHLSEDDATVKRAAAAALGEIGDPRAARRLIEALEDSTLESTALEALRRMGGAGLAEIERALPAIGGEARRLLVNLIGKIEDRRTAKVLLAMLNDVAPMVRAEAALALGDGGHLEAVRPLMQVKATDASADVRQSAAIALGKLAPRSKT